MAQGTIQPTLSGQADMAEITSPDYPGERLIACYNPFLAAQRGPQARRTAERHRGRTGKDRRRDPPGAPPLRGKDAIALAMR